MVIMSIANATAKGYVSAVNEDGDNAAEFTVLSYGAANMATALGSTATTSELVRVLVIGSEFEKGTNARSSANAPQFKSHSNKHIILKDYYEVSGSDASQIGWVEISGEEGQTVIYGI